MMPTWDRARLIELAGALCDEKITDEEFAELSHILAAHADARQLYQQCVATHLCIKQVGESILGGVDAAGSQSGGGTEKSESEGAQLARNASEGVAPSLFNARSHFRTVARAVREALGHPIALLLIVGFVSAGILAYVFSTRQADQPVAQKPLPAELAAKVVSTADAKWAGPSIPNGEAIKPGQRLVLQRGSAEIVFGKQARVIFEGPADFVITDAATCRLDGGKLTAHVPEAARGFKVHTPEGTVTDLGTEFGVYVKSEVRSEKSEVEEQQEEGQPQEAVKLPPITEVHVFKGQVDITTAPTDHKSKIENPKSKILSAGQAVTISQQKVQPLPAADPFKFALDKLQGKPRQVLLSEDFEAYDEGNQVKVIGPWIVQSSTRKGQGVSINDLTKAMAESNAVQPNPNFAIPPAIGVRSVDIAASAQNPTETFPLLAREIDGRPLGGTGQVLVEFDLMPSGLGVQPSLALATEVGHTAGIELWHDADPAVPPVEWNWNQPYRVRVLLDVVKGTVRAARVQRSRWRGQEGWVFDRTFHPPIPKLDWTTPPRYAIFGYPTVTADTPAAHFWLDNIRIEVIAEN